MTLLTDTGRIRRHWLAAMLLSSLIFLTGATWYFTPNLKFMPAGTPTPTPKNPIAAEPPDGGSDRDRSQAPVATNSTFAPFLDIVPLTDGTGLDISAGGVGELGGTVFANIDAGSGHHKGSTPMIYSGAVYVATIGDFTPYVGASAPINITTTLGLDTGVVEFNRAYIPASTTPTINSIDGLLELILVSTDTFPSNAYVVVVPSYTPPGPLPAGHRLVGSSYSVRASGALVTSDASMSLRLYYNDITLTGADPHTLAIFAWDASNKEWDRLDGTLFSSSTPPKVSVVTDRFTTYALMATTAWHDDFNESTGLDFTQSNNVTLEETSGNPTLITTPGSGSLVSQPITPTTTFSGWHMLTFTPIVEPPTTTLTVDILSLDGSEVLTDVASGTDLADLIDPVQYPSLRLRVNMTSTEAGEIPALDQWHLTWQVNQNTVYLPVILKEK
ncbi:MAG: hypothetical protein GY792_29495 [Gammaproteobacteria bacterium]|nr:hypothetical protein [Gammaproteobacteria bacterium]